MFYLIIPRYVKINNFMVLIKQPMKMSTRYKESSFDLVYFWTGKHQSVRPTMENDAVACFFQKYGCVLSLNVNEPLLESY